jgi:hypothetical protein
MDLWLAVNPSNTVTVEKGHENFVAEGVDIRYQY